MCSNNLATILPARVCFCCPLDIGVQVTLPSTAATQNMYFLSIGNCALHYEVTKLLEGDIQASQTCFKISEILGNCGAEGLISRGFFFFCLQYVKDTKTLKESNTPDQVPIGDLSEQKALETLCQRSAAFHLHCNICQTFCLSWRNYTTEFGKTFQAGDFIDFIKTGCLPIHCYLNCSTTKECLESQTNEYPYQHEKPTMTLQLFTRCWWG